MRGGRTLLLIALLLLHAGQASATTEDPWEGFNRKMHGFNMALDRWALEPVAKGWDFVMPELVQTGLANVFENLSMPVAILNDILMLRPKHAGQDVARFVINSSAGLGGLFDVATRQNIPDNNADFGLTLACYGTPTGPYLVVPIFGPRNVRDTFGLAADVAATPYGYFVPFYVSLVTRTVQIINQRARFLEMIATERDAALDFYIFTRDAYIQNREFEVCDRARSVPSDDMYYYEDEEFGDSE